VEKLNNKNIKSDHGENLWHLAAFYAQPKIIERLIEWGVKPCLDETKRTAFHSFLAGARKHGRRNSDETYRTAVLLLKAGVNPVKKCQAGEMPSFELTRHGIFPAIRAMMEFKVPLDEGPDENRGTNVLHLLCKNANEYRLEFLKELITLLLETKSIDPDRRDNSRKTPKEYAILSGKEEVVALFAPNFSNVQRTGDLTLDQALEIEDCEAAEALLNSGADPNEVSAKTHRTPLMTLCLKPIFWENLQNGRRYGDNEKNFFDMVDLLLERGADVNVRTGNNFNALYCFLLNLRFETKLRLLDLLIKHGLDASAPMDDQANSALMLLCHSPWPHRMNYRVAEKLLDAGANPSAKNKVGSTALMYDAAHFGNGQEEEIAELLIARGADVNAVNNDGNTALMYAARNHVESIGKRIAELILATGVANLDQANNNNQTALDIAVANGKESIVKLLSK
jgi:ankyrin repeat protein